MFVGYGLEDPRFGLDDYAGSTCKGKVVAYLYGTPEGVPSEEAASLNSTRGKTIAAARARSASVMLFTPALDKLISVGRCCAPMPTRKRCAGYDRRQAASSKTPTLRIGGTLGAKASAACC